jgi:hypothetical protein
MVNTRDQVRKCLTIEAVHAGVVYGRRGKTLHGLQTAYGVQISFPWLNERAYKNNVIIVILTGEQRQVQLAENAIQMLLDKRRDKLNNCLHLRIDIPHTSRHRVMTKDGVLYPHMKKWVDDVQVTVDKVNRQQNVSRLSIHGKREAVFQAEHMILQHIPDAIRIYEPITDKNVQELPTPTTKLWHYAPQSAKPHTDNYEIDSSQPFRLFYTALDTNHHGPTHIKQQDASLWNDQSNMEHLFPAFLYTE